MASLLNFMTYQPTLYVQEVLTLLGHMVYCLGGKAIVEDKSELFADYTPPEILPQESRVADPDLVVFKGWIRFRFIHLYSEYSFFPRYLTKGRIHK